MTDLITSSAVVEFTGAKRLRQRFFRDKFAVAGLMYLTVLAVIAALANVIAPYPAGELNAGGAQAFEAPSLSHFLGTDDLGRDTLSRIMFGSQFALRDALFVVALTLVVGVPIGLLAGWYGSWADNVLMRMMDGINSVPAIILILSVAEVTNQALIWALVAIAVTFVPALTRLVRSATLSVREELYIEASIVAGTPTRRIILKRVLPNIMPPIIVQASITAGAAIFIQATLAVLGIGYPAGTPAWGAMLNEAFQSMAISFWGMFYPGLAIALTVLAFNLVGDGLRDAFGLERGSIYGSKPSMGLTLAIRQLRTAAQAQRFGSQPSLSDVLLSVDRLTVEVRTKDGRVLQAVDDVSFDVRRGEVVGVVGESGSGKTVTALAIMRLLPSPPFEIAGGSIRFDGSDLINAAPAHVRRMRGNDIAMIFQDPMTALNPALTVGRQIAESVRLHEQVSRRMAERRAIEMLDRVGIPDARRRARAYPFEFSGGMRQRAMIAIALACSPKLLIADEPTTALDVTVQQQILEVLRDLQKEFGLSIIFVTHDLGVVAEFCDRVVVMYAGQTIEQARVDDLFAHPQHPYTWGLLGAVPKLGSRESVTEIPGRVPPLGAMDHGCRFAPRCRFVLPECRDGIIAIADRGTSLSRCIRVLDEAGTPS
jgi:peptide/nickel transport system permease protein